MGIVFQKVTGFFIAAAALLSVFYVFFPFEAVLALLITACTTLYHLLMRLCVGGIVNGLLHNQVDYRRLWFQPLPFEARLYRHLKVKHWKKHLPAYQPDLFDLSKHSLDEIVGATCQAEIVHEIIVVLSFVPLFSVPYLGAFWVFLITSLLSAAFDLCFVMIQRYNRPRIIKCIKHARVL